jgi:hypothetical protein
MIIRDLNITKSISLHTSPENMFYIIPTLCTHKLDMRQGFSFISYLLAIKWLNFSVGIRYTKRF